MDVVLKHIEFLLSHHDCVVVPGFGAFIASYEPAHYNEKWDCYVAPRRVFAFNESLRQSDGLLAFSIAQNLKISYEKANSIVAKAVSDFRAELMRNGELSFGRLGRIDMSLNGRLIFTASEIDRLSVLSGWLGNIKHVSENIAAEVEEKTYENKTRNKTQRFTHFYRTAAGAVAAILLAIVVSTPVAFKDVYKASTVVTVTKPHKIEIQAPEAEIVKPTTNDITQSPAEINEGVAELKNVQISEKPTQNISQPITVSEQSGDDDITGDDTESLRLDPNDPYKLIIGSFMRQSEAELFISQGAHTGLKMAVTVEGSKHRVYVASGETISEVMKISRDPRVSRYYSQCWVAKDRK